MKQNVLRCPSSLGALESAAYADLADAEETGEAERIRQTWRPLRAA
jgi:hypothetical protein